MEFKALRGRIVEVMARAAERIKIRQGRNFSGSASRVKTSRLFLDRATR
jgi:hypothetical protein